MRIRSTPASSATSACHGCATVIAQAPASTCRRKIAGDIVVLPCGANEMPNPWQNAASVAMSWASARSRSTNAGSRIDGSKRSRPIRASVADTVVMASAAPSRVAPPGGSGRGGERGLGRLLGRGDERQLGLVLEARSG